MESSSSLELNTNLATSDDDESSSRSNNNNNNINKTSNSFQDIDEFKGRPPAKLVRSNSFSDILSRLVMGRDPVNKNPESANSSGINDSNDNNKIAKNQTDFQKNPSPVSVPPNLSTSHTASNQAWPKQKNCKPPLSRKFGHPCNCGISSNNHYKPSYSLSALINSTSGLLPPAAYTNPIHLYDPISKKCLPTSRNRDMLLKECPHYVNIAYPLKPHHTSPCFYDDLVCDARRFRCVCKPPLHLFYESNSSTFACVPIGPSSSPDGRVNCRPDYIYNVISRECQKIFDVNELQPNPNGVSATQFSFITIILIWILLLILIVTAKLRKLGSSNYFRGSPASERRSYRTSSYRHTNQGPPSWLHPFFMAVNAHNHRSHHRAALDHRLSQPTGVEDSSAYNDTDFFLTNGSLRIHEMHPDNNFTSSQLSLNNPPPKFEEIYPTCTDATGLIQPPSLPPPLPPPSNEDLPSYDEAMKLQNTMPPESKE